MESTIFRLRPDEEGRALRIKKYQDAVIEDHCGREETREGIMFYKKDRSTRGSGSTM